MNSGFAMPGCRCVLLAISNLWMAMNPCSCRGRVHSSHEASEPRQSSSAQWYSARERVIGKRLVIQRCRACFIREACCNAGSTYNFSSEGALFTGSSARGQGEDGECFSLPSSEKGIFAQSPSPCWRSGSRPTLLTMSGLPFARFTPLQKPSPKESKTKVPSGAREKGCGSFGRWTHPEMTAFLFAASQPAMREHIETWRRRLRNLKG